MSVNLKALLGGIVKSAATAGEVALQAGVKGRQRDLGTCTPCAGAARAQAAYEKNMALMGQGQGKKSKKRKSSTPASAPKKAAPSAKPQHQSH